MDNPAYTKVTTRIVKRWRSAAMNTSAIWTCGTTATLAFTFAVGASIPTASVWLIAAGLVIAIGVQIAAMRMASRVRSGQFGESSWEATLIVKEIEAMRWEASNG